jgi:hypothetical protein
MVKTLKYGILPALALLVLSSCENFSLTRFLQGDALATVGDARLYPEEVAPLFTPGIDPADSLKLLNSYVDNWVKQQLKIRMAENYSPEEEDRIARMVSDYRNSLLIYEFEKQYLDERLDTAVTREQIDEYYAAGSTGFLLTEPLVKAIVVKFPTGFRQEGRLRELTRFSNNTERYQDLVDLAIKNSLEYREFNDWTELSEVAALLPRLTESENATLRSGVSFFEKAQGEVRYFLVLTGILPEGSPVPVARVSETIRTLILNRRRQELLQKMENDLLQAALIAGDATIAVDTVMTVVNE